MCALASHIPTIINEFQEPAHVTYFGWDVNCLNYFYFGRYGPNPVLNNQENKVLDFCTYE